MGSSLHNSLCQDSRPDPELFGTAGIIVKEAPARPSQKAVDQNPCFGFFWHIQSSLLSPTFAFSLFYDCQQAIKGLVKFQASLSANVLEIGEIRYANPCFIVIPNHSNCGSAELNRWGEPSQRLRCRKLYLAVWTCRRNP